MPCARAWTFHTTCMSLHARVAHFLFHQETGDHTRDLAAGFKTRAGHAHQADAAAAENKPNLVFGKRAAEVFGCRTKCWIAAGAGGAVEADGI